MSKKRKKISLGFKINTIILISCLMFAFICGFILYLISMKIIEQKYDDSRYLLSIIVEENREEIANEIFAEQDIALGESLKDIVKVTGVSGACVYDQKGVLLLSAGKKFTNKLSGQEMLALDKNSVFLRSTSYVQHMGSYSSVIKVIDEQLGYIKIYYDYTKLKNRIRQIGIVFIVLYIGTILILSLILYLSLSFFILKPVLVLKNAMEKLDSNALGVKVDFSAQDEIGEIGAVFNKMSETLLQNDTDLKGAVKTEAEYALKLKNANKELEKSNNELAILNVDLEKTVHDRTSALVESNINLQNEIDEKEKMKNDLIRVEKLESIGLLAGGIAHDFNNILFPIMGYTEMLLKDISEDSPFHDSLNKIYSGTLRARDLVKQILTFSHQERSELNLMKMQPIIKEALELIRSTIPTTIEIKHDIQTDCGVIKADPTQIHQIVMNFATNAYHSMEKTGGELNISLKKVELGNYDVITPDMIPGEYACLTVSDTGTGMDKDLIEKIFDPFFTTKAIGKGTGMGLSVIHGIVLGMGGAIQVNSKPGKGTQFDVYLPVEKSLSEGQPANSNVKIQSGTEHILLIDDEEEIITMEKQLLEHLGYQVTSQISSVEALEVFQANLNKFDLVITDMQMPNIPGDKLSAELIKINPDIPVLLCTGHSEIMSEEEAFSLGIKGFLLKPILLEDLSQKIREILDSNKNENTN
jgi:signal transduction histidine kinase/ActR/RegA family two-component response regulator